MGDPAHPNWIPHFPTRAVTPLGDESRFLSRVGRSTPTVTAAQPCCAAVPVERPSTTRQIASEVRTRLIPQSVRNDANTSDGLTLVPGTEQGLRLPSSVPPQLVMQRCILSG